MPIPMINQSDKQRWLAGTVSLHELEEYGRKQAQRERDAINVDQLAEAINVSKRTFQRWEAKGDAPRSYQKRGRNIYIPDEFHSWWLEIVKSQTDTAVFAKLVPHITKDMPLDLLNQQGAAEMIGVTPRTMKRWADKRCGPVSVRIGRGVYYPRAFLEIWRDQNPRRNGRVK